MGSQKDDHNKRVVLELGSCITLFFAMQADQVSFPAVYIDTVYTKI